MDPGGPDPAAQSGAPRVRRERLDDGAVGAGDGAGGVASGVRDRPGRRAMRAGDGGERYASRDSTTLLAALITTLGVAVLYLTNAAAGGSFALRGLPLDDAWIHQVYARSAALGRPFQYNPGEWETGSTSPLWSTVTASPARALAPPWNSP